MEAEISPKATPEEEDKELWMRRGNNSYYGLCHCADCKKDAIIRFKLSRRDGLHWAVARVAEVLTEESRARWQKQKKLLAERLKKKNQPKAE